MTTLEKSMGAAGIAGLDWGFEHIWYKYPNMRGKFPFIEIIPQLPPLDDWVVALTAAGLFGIGKARNSETLKEMGRGGLLYSLGMLLHHILLRSITFRKSRGVPASPCPCRR